MYIFYLIPLKKKSGKIHPPSQHHLIFASYTPTKNAARFYVMDGGNLLFLFLPLFVQSLLEKNTLDLCLPWGLRQPWWQRQKVTSNNPQYQPTNGNMFIYSYKQLSTALNKKTKTLPKARRIVKDMERPKGSVTYSALRDGWSIGISLFFLKINLIKSFSFYLIVRYKNCLVLFGALWPGNFQIPSIDLWDRGQSFVGSAKSDEMEINANSVLKNFVAQHNWLI